MLRLWTIFLWCIVLQPYCINNVGTQHIQDGSFATHTNELPSPQVSELSHLSISQGPYDPETVGHSDIWPPMRSSQQNQLPLSVLFSLPGPQPRSHAATWDNSCRAGLLIAHCNTPPLNSSLLTGLTETAPSVSNTRSLAGLCSNDYNDSHNLRQTQILVILVCFRLVPQTIIIHTNILIFMCHLFINELINNWCPI